ncbi:MAG: hypothetical protein H0T70_02160, partial [Acidimicrobiia bacterium]|nr:hypothetical protein [Acidimicrobiia bacterium]
TQPTGTTTTTQPTGTTTTTQPTGTTTSTTTVLSGLDCETLTPAGDATAEANPTSVLAGNDTSVTGSGFEPGESLDLGLCSSPVSLGRVTADPSGNFSATVTVPAGTAAGAHTIVVSSIDRLRIATASLTVVAPGGGGGDGGGGGQAPLARTGADTARIVWLAGLALLTGAVLVRSARRTRRWPYRSR